MLYYVKGQLVAADVNFAAVDVGNVAYRCSISYNTFLKISGKREVLLYTYLAVREDAVELFGFADEQEQGAFRQLIAVSGVGPKAALSVLSSMTPQRLEEAVEAEDFRLISKAQGIGSKTAQKIVLELKGKLSTFGDGERKTENKGGSAELKREAEQALIVLGYTKQDAAKAVDKAAAPGDGVEDIIKKALATMMR